jgi:hypothetical protein
MADTTKAAQAAEGAAALKVHHLRPGAGRQDRQDPRGSR